MTRLIPQGERMIVILALLKESATGLMSTDDLLRRAPGYDDDATSRERLTRDIAALRRRGLVQSDISTASTPNHTGVQLIDISKPVAFTLSREEHQALQWAWHQRYDRQQAAVIDGMPADSVRDLDRALDAVRVLEEHQAPLELEIVAERIGASVSETLRAVKLIWLLDSAGGPINASDMLELEHMDGADLQVNDDNGHLAVALIRPPQTGADTLHGTGLDNFGRFAYTAAEVVDRCSLIDDVLGDEALAIPDETRDLLTSARYKLDCWGQHLAQHSQASAVP